MKGFPRFLNLNGVGTKILGLAIIFGFVLPSGAFLVSLVLSAFRIFWDPFPWITIFWLIGGILLSGLIVLVVIEQVQDRLVYRDFLKNQSNRLPVSERYSECPYCGNRQVLKEETTCRVCGQTLKG